MSADLTLEDLPAARTGPTTVLVVDDNPVVRRGLRSFLDVSDRVEVVGEASDGVLAESMVRSLKPDVVLLDVRMPRRDGIATAKVIASEATVLMLTFTDEPEHIRAALAAGASGYLVHGAFDADTLVQTVVSAAAGTGAFSHQVLEALRGAPADQGPDAAVREARDRFGLSERQAELMELICQGLSNREIAGQLFLAEKTVKNHVNAILAKLGARNRSEAIAAWLGTRGA